MPMIIGRSLTPFNSRGDCGASADSDVPCRDDNSRGEVQNVRADSSAKSRMSVTIARRDGRYHGASVEVDDASPQRQRDSGSAVSNAKLAKDIPRMHLYSLFADAERFGNLPVLHAVGH